MANNGRNTRKYYFKVGNKIVHGGISDRDLTEREQEHRNSGKVSKAHGQIYNWSKGHIVQVGVATTKEAALKWERDIGFGANKN